MKKIMRQAKCAELGLTKSGRKADLVAGSSVMFMVQKLSTQLTKCLFCTKRCCSMLIHIVLFYESIDKLT